MFINVALLILQEMTSQECLGGMLSTALPEDDAEITALGITILDQSTLEKDVEKKVWA